MLIGPGESLRGRTAGLESGDVFNATVYRFLGVGLTLFPRSAPRGRPAGGFRLAGGETALAYAPREELESRCASGGRPAMPGGDEGGLRADIGA